MEKYICLLLLWGCANVVPPSGGPKDTSPPKVVYVEPGNRSTNFKGNKIVILFDEYIQIKNKLSIQMSPACDTGLKIEERGRRLELTIDCLLAPNTTYTVHFGKSILDLNEGNVLENFKYVFSTGPLLDSITLSGNARELYSGQSVSDACIGLYKNFDSLVSPYYYTFSDQNGDFIIENIKDDNYTLFAIEDNNRNFINDPDELISFPEEIIEFQDNKNIGMFLEKPLNVIKKVTNINKYAIRFDHDIITPDSISVLNLDGLWQTGEHFSTFWFDDSVNFILYSIRGLMDSIKVYKTEPDSVIPKISALLNIDDIQKNKHIVLTCNKPIKRVFSNKFKWTFRDEFIEVVQSDPFTIKIPLNFDSLSEEELIVEKGAIIDRYNQINDSILFHFDFNPNHYGSLNVSSSLSRFKNKVLEIFKQNTVIKRTILTDSVFIQYINPGSYNVRIFDDLNQDFVWTPGQIDSTNYPEPIINYPEPINIKANWEIYLNLDSIY